MEKIELNVPEYSWYNNGEGIDESILDIYNKYKSLERVNKQLREKNSSLKSEHYKDEELQRLKEENEKLQNKLNRGFGISEQESKAIKIWQTTHDCTLEGLKTKGISSYRFEIIPGIGYNGYVKCSCGKEFCFYEE